MFLGEPVASGKTADIYLVDGMIFKIFKKNLPCGEAEYEAGKQVFAYSKNLPVPCVLDVTKINGRQVIVMEYVEGKNIGKLLSEENLKHKKRQYLELSADIQIKINSISAVGIEKMDDRLHRKIISASLLNNKQKSTLIEKMDGIKKDDKLCHGDYHFFNLIYNNSRVKIIDWADATSGDSRADVCRTYLLYTQFSIDLAQSYLNVYCDKSGFSENDILQWLPVLAGARLSENISKDESSNLIEVVNKLKNF